MLDNARSVSSIVLGVARVKPQVGDVVEIALPCGWRAYGRVLRDAAIGIYDGGSRGARSPPIGSRKYQFVVGIYEDALRALPVVGRDPSESLDADWPPPMCVTDPITGRKSIYHRGEITQADPDACAGLEPAAAWDLGHIVERIETGALRRAAGRCAR